MQDTNVHICSTFTKTQYSTRPKLDSIAMIALLSSVEGKSHRRPCQKNVQKEGLEIVATPSTLTTDFLDIELNLSTREYKPYRKPNDNPIYINSKSNHPNMIIKQLPIWQIFPVNTGLFYTLLLSIFTFFPSSTVI